MSFPGKFYPLVFLALFLLAGAVHTGCQSPRADYEHALFEVEQGNLPNAKKLLSRIPAGSPYRAKADSLLGALEPASAP